MGGRAGPRTGRQGGRLSCFTDANASLFPRRFCRARYYVVSNLTGAGGITISTNDVNLDLNGFALVGGSGVGISAVGRTNLVIRDGTVSNWTSAGVSLASGHHSRVTHVGAYNNNGPGINAGAAAEVVKCISGLNIGGFGVVTGGSSLVRDCIAVQNSQGGIATGGNSAVVSCLVSNNIGLAISVLDGCIVRDCSATGNSGGGISAGSRCIVSGCISAGNTGSGISVTSDNLVVRNLCVGNTATGPNGAGIFSPGGGNRIEDNVLNSNSRGIQLNSGSNLIIRNSARANGTNYLFSGIETFGPTNNAVDATGVITNQNPWANLSF